MNITGGYGPLFLSQESSVRQRQDAQGAQDVQGAQDAQALEAPREMRWLHIFSGAYRFLPVFVH